MLRLQHFEFPGIVAVLVDQLSGIIALWVNLERVENPHSHRIAVEVALDLCIPVSCEAGVNLKRLAERRGVGFRVGLYAENVIDWQV